MNFKASSGHSYVSVVHRTQLGCTIGACVALLASFGLDAFAPAAITSLNQRVMLIHCENAIGSSGQVAALVGMILGIILMIISKQTRTSLSTYLKITLCIACFFLQPIFGMA